jgi:hypothetical protein
MSAEEDKTSLKITNFEELKNHLCQNDSNIQANAKLANLEKAIEKVKKLINWKLIFENTSG